MTDASVLRIHADALDSFYEANPRLGVKFLKEIGKVISSRVRAMSAA